VSSRAEAAATLAVDFEKQQNYTPAPQQTYESSEAYQQRINSGNKS
jgi:hypothetical protein